jgi:WD40 repeat protein
MENTRRRSADKEKQSRASQKSNQSITIPQLPTSLWIEHVLPLLDRVSWNRLCSTFRELYAASQRLNPPWPHKSLQVGSWHRTVAFSPNGGLLACGSRDGIVRIRNNCNGRCTNLGNSKSHPQLVRAISFSPDGKVLASASDDRKIRLWRLADSSCRILEGHDDGIMSVAFSPNGSLLASGSCPRDGSVRLWDVNTGRCTHILRDVRTITVFSVAFSPDGSMLAAGGSCGAIFLWNLSDGDEDNVRPLARIVAKRNIDMRTIAYSSDGRYLASGSSDGTVRLWNTSDLSCKAVFKGHTDFVRSVSFSPNGKVLASGGDDNGIRFWNVESTEHILVLPKHHENYVYSVAFSPDGRTFASGGWDRVVRLWNPNEHDRRKQKGNWDELIRLWNVKA